jgi:glycosyltransferase involved in cell wall biosynthesis
VVEEGGVEDGPRDMRLSLIIPTYNRVALLDQAVRSAIAVDDPDGETEIIVVDNASTDGTPELVKRLLPLAPGRLRYVREERLGLHHARHAGAKAARGEVLVFTDDDATFDRGFLRAHGRAFAEHPEMAAAGGSVRPVWETPPPEWLVEYTGGDFSQFAMLSLMEPYSEFHLDSEGYFFGVNMAIRRELLFGLGGFNPETFGRDVCLGDGESGLNRKLTNRGLLIGYVPDAVVYHHIPTRRMALESFISGIPNIGACDTYARFHGRAPTRASLCRHAVAAAARTVWLRFAAAVTSALKGPRAPRSVSTRFRAARTRGQLAYILRMIWSPELRQLVMREDWLKPEDVDDLASAEKVADSQRERLRSP